MLDRYGVITMSVLSHDAREKWAERIWQAMDEFPEYKGKGKKIQRSLGGFGAYGNPASFHHPTIQRWKTTRCLNTNL